MTSILARVLAVLLALALLVGAGLGVVAYTEHQRAEKLTEQNTALQQSLASTQAAFDAYATATKQATQRAVTNQKKVSDALASHPDWRDEPVPDDVFDSLFGNRPRASTEQPASAVSGTGRAN